MRSSESSSNANLTSRRRSRSSTDQTRRLRRSPRARPGAQGRGRELGFATPAARSRRSIWTRQARAISPIASRRSSTCRPSREIEVLGEADVPTRIRLLVKRIPAKPRRKPRCARRSSARSKQELGKNQREHVLREQMRAIKRELGEDDRRGRALRARRSDSPTRSSPKTHKRVVDRELRRLESMGGQGAEVNVIRTYLELIADLPWSKRVDAAIDLDKISAKLEADHHGLEDTSRSESSASTSRSSSSRATRRRAA